MVKKDAEVYCTELAEDKEYPIAAFGIESMCGDSATACVGE